MSRTAPYVIAALVFGAAAAWSIHLAVAPDPFALSSAAVISIGLMLNGLIAVAGLLLSRGRWSKHLSIATVGATLFLGVALKPGPWYWAGLVLTALAIVGLTGPWLQGWVRRLPAAEGPGTKPLIAVFAALAIVPAIGVASPSGLTLAHGFLGGAAVLLTWAFSRAELWGLWGLRLALPVFAIGPVIQSPWGGRLLLIGLVATVTAMTWTNEARIAVQPLLDRLPGPRVATPPPASSAGPTP